MHPWDGVRREIDRSIVPASAPPRPRRRAQPEPGWVSRPRPHERPRHRPQPKLLLGVAALRCSRRSGVLRPAPFLRGRDATGAPAHPPAAARRDGLVSPATGAASACLGGEYSGGAAVRGSGRASVPRDALDRRYRAKLAKPPIPRDGVFRGRASAVRGERPGPGRPGIGHLEARDRKSTRLNSSHTVISYAVFCLKKKKKT